MTLEEIVKEVDQKKFRPIYLLMGDEPYYIDRLCDYIQSKVLSEEERSFNEYILYGKDVGAVEIDNVARRFPMMAPHQLVLVKEAQLIKKIEDLVHYASQPQPTTVLILAHKYKSIPKNRKLYKAIEKNGVVFESKKLYDSQIAEWVTSYLRKRKWQIDPASAQLIAENLGNDLSKISNELDKLLLVSNSGQQLVTPELIQSNIGISKDYNTFELQKALGMRQEIKAYRIVQYFASNQKEHPFVLSISSLYAYFSKLLLLHFSKDKSPRNLASVLGINPYFVNEYLVAAKNYSPRKVVDIIHLLREYDLKSKGVDANATEPGELLRELIFKILN